MRNIKDGQVRGKYTLEFKLAESTDYRPLCRATTDRFWSGAAIVEIIAK